MATTTRRNSDIIVASNALGILVKGSAGICTACDSNALGNLARAIVACKETASRLKASVAREASGSNVLVGVEPQAARVAFEVFIGSRVATLAVSTVWVFI